ncbi:MAG: gamma-glutamyltransferase [Gammaproteobacteria bacterium]
MRNVLMLFCLAGASFFPFQVFAETPAQAAVVTAHPLATEAGVEILKSGGNAFDAAAAITASLAVVEPYSSGLGGGGFWLLHRAADGKQVMIDGRETAPALVDKNTFLDEKGNVRKGASLNGPLAAGIPGVPAGIEHLVRHYGQLSLAAVLAPAIRHAREGFPVTARYRKLAGYRLDVLRSYHESATTFLHNKEIPPLGHLILQDNLARTLELFARDGAKGFYSGIISGRMVQGVQRNGGIWDHNDLTNYAIVERAPIVINYNGIRIVSAAPPSSGGIVLGQALNILENFELSTLGGIKQKHVIIEAMRRAYRDRAAYLGDPGFTDIPVQRLLDKEYAEGLAESIALVRATSSVEIGGTATFAETGTNTTHFSVIDTEGNRVAATLSINLPFGSGYVPPGTGVLLNDEMDDFAVRPMTPNAYGLVGDQENSVEPGKRPLSSMTPTFLETDDRVAILGTPGGSRIISMVLLAVLDFAEDRLPSSWVSLPRYHHQYLPDQVQFEKEGLTPREQEGLQKLGHTLQEKKRRYGNMQALMWWKEKNLVFAASDPRGEGKASVITMQEIHK